MTRLISKCMILDNDECFKNSYSTIGKKKDVISNFKFAFFQTVFEKLSTALSGLYFTISIRFES